MRYDAVQPPIGCPKLAAGPFSQCQIESIVGGRAFELLRQRPSAFGKLGRTSYEGWSFGFGPRAGITVPVGDHAFFDLSGTYSIVGLERFRAVAGIGFRSF